MTLATCISFKNATTYNMEILSIDATYPESCHDSFIWNNSRKREFFQELVIPLYLQIQDML